MIPPNMYNFVGPFKIALISVSAILSVILPEIPSVKPKKITIEQEKKNGSTDPSRGYGNSTQSSRIIVGGDWTICPVEKFGENYLGLCPFYEERTPSFLCCRRQADFSLLLAVVSGGNVCLFLQEPEGLSFPEAVGKSGRLLEQIPLEDQWRQRTI